MSQRLAELSHALHRDTHLLEQTKGHRLNVLGGEGRR